MTSNPDQNPPSNPCEDCTLPNDHGVVVCTECEDTIDKREPMVSPLKRWWTLTEQVDDTTPDLSTSIGINAHIDKRGAYEFNLIIGTETPSEGVTSAMLVVTEAQLATLGTWLTAITSPLSDEQWACMQQGDDS